MLAPVAEGLLPVSKSTGQIPQRQKPQNSILQ